MKRNIEYTRKKSYDALRALIVKQTAQKFEVTTSYVRLCLNGTKDYGKSREINKYFTAKYEQMEKLIEN